MERTEAYGGSSELKGVVRLFKSVVAGSYGMFHRFLFSSSEFISSFFLFFKLKKILKNKIK